MKEFKKSNKKVSVIVPIYNVEKYLAKCLDSIIHQTLKEIEIILVNDGSLDNSLQICEKFAQKDRRIKIIDKPNGGLSDARNAGLDIATGEFISFVDADDYIDLTMLETMYNLAFHNHAQIAFCNLIKVNENGKEFKKLIESYSASTQLINLKKDFSYFGEMSCFACNKIFKKELFKENRFKKGLHFEDIELIPKLFLEAKTVVKNNNYFYKYFERQNSISKSYSIKGLDVFDAINSITKAFKESEFKTEIKELKRFQILQGFYSFLAYVAYVKDKKIKKEMITVLAQKLKEYQISKTDIITYKRFNFNYLLSLNPKKIIFYTIAIINLRWLKYF